FLGCALFLQARRPDVAAVFLGTTLFAWAVEWLAKVGVSRQRPNVAWRLIPLPNEYSFPSGPALMSVTVYGSLVLLIAAGGRGGWPRRRPVAAGIGLALVIGLTRVYLGVHFPIDVIAGWCAGLAFALAAREAVRSRGRRWGPEPRPPV